MKNGKAYLVGAGPGDIQLITVKGMEAIKKAEVILYDRLANPQLLEFAQAECELIYCGKLPDRHVLRQEMINDLLVDKVLEGKIVVRLKGGDPGVFGRVGEEAEALAGHGLSYEVVPGITSGVAASMYAGIPVTHREFGESFAVVTAHDKSKDGHPNLNWQGLAAGVDTIAFYMGVSNLPFICENLIKHGKPATTPVILIQWGTFSRQKTLEGTLADIADKAKQANFTNPAITLVGEIVSLRKKLNWFEKKPLFGKQILLARTGTATSELARQLQEQGADVIQFPKWKETAVPVDLTIVNKLEQYESILFTSPESVVDFFKIVINEGIDIRRIKGNFYGMSLKSVRALNEKGFAAELEQNMPASGELLVVCDRELSGKQPGGDIFYTSKTVLDQQFLPILSRMVEEANINSVILPSVLGVKVLFETEELQGIIPTEILAKSEIVCMGSKTAQAAHQYGLKTDVVLEAPTNAAVIECLAAGKHL